MTDVLIPAALVQNAKRFGGRREGDAVRGTPQWDRGVLIGLGDPAGGPATTLIPKLVETHCHLDKCHTIHRMGAVGGDLMGAIEAQRQDKDHWTAEDIAGRAQRGLDEARKAGCDLIRSHVDWGDAADAPLAWHILRDLDAPELQRAALLGIGQWADEDFCAAAMQQIASAGGVAGAFILRHPDEMIAAGLANMFRAARAHDVMLDFHVDEGLGAYGGVEMIADMALQVPQERPILCGHAVALMDKQPEDFARISGKLAEAQITICALPSTNLYLQGRGTGTPDRRGITRLRELQAAGVRICVGSDNVGDAFCPTGAHDPMAALNLACLTAHLDPPLGQWLPMITSRAATALGAAPRHVDGARAKDLLAFKTETLPDLIAGRAVLCEVPT